ncbi:hypothetical protein A5727_01675 [Mycobacterium sp. ACS4331]|nr:hypothetical protein A5727_01675 [Mycobacterium sp. ACS4331]
MERPPHQPRRAVGLALFAGLSALYFAVGAVLVLRYNLFDPDSPSRVANAGYVVMSRHAHLSAIGFVWNPLPSLVQIPLMGLSHWWPALKTHGLAGVIQSSMFMAAAAVMIRRIALDRGLGTGWVWLAVGCFALQPAIIVYGASGMSEAAQMFCVLWAVRYLLLWVDSRWPGHLGWAGIALGVGYLARYELVPAACGVMLLVAVLAWLRPPPGERLANSLLSVSIVAFPIVLSAAIWAITGWIVSDQLFATVSSQYGNESQVSAAASHGGPQGLAASSDWVVIAARLLGMQPFVVIAVAGAVALTVLTRRVEHLVAVAAIGPMVLFTMWGQYSSLTFGWFRFYLMAVPLVLCIAITCWRPGAEQPSRWRTGTPVAKLGAVLISLSIAVGFPVTLLASADSRIGNQQLQFGLMSLMRDGDESSQQQWYRRLLVTDRTLADYFDRRNLPDGSVLMDSFATWGVWLESDRPRQFVITSDYDFRAALNRPWDYGVRYIVTVNPAVTDADAVNRRYPTIWADGAGIGRLALTVYGATGDERFRVYEVTEPPSPAVAEPPAGPPAG